MKRVAPGEPITSRHLSARWYNSTLDKPPRTPPPPPGKKSGKQEGEFEATLIGGGTVARFDPVGLDSRVDTYGKNTSKAHKVSIAATNKYNWIIPQLEMSDNAKTQPCVYYGVTWANVLITDETHQFVDYEDGQLVSSNSGKGQILVGAASSEEPQQVFISIGNHSGSVLVGFRVTGEGSEGSYPAVFDDLHGNEIGEGTLLDPKGITGGLLGNGWEGEAMFQNGEYYFVNASCNQETLEEEETTTTTGE